MKYNQFMGAMDLLNGRSQETFKLNTRIDKMNILCRCANTGPEWKLLLGLERDRLVPMYINKRTKWEST